jgi:hypothetical protein
MVERNWTGSTSKISLTAGSVYCMSAVSEGIFELNAYLKEWSELSAVQLNFALSLY